MSGCFRVYRDLQNTNDIHFEQLELQDGTTIPEDQLELRDEVDKTLTVIRMLFENNSPLFEEYFRPLLSLSQLGLVGDSANPKLAMRALSSLKEEIVSRQGGRIKNEYMIHLGKYSLLFGLPPLILAIIALKYFPPIKQISCFFFLWTGCMAGVWLSFGARKIVLNFDELHILEKDRLNPVVRLIFAGLLTIVIGLLLSTGAIVMELGSLSTKSFGSNIEVSILVGLLCGLSEQALSTKISQHASEFLKIT